MKLIIGIILFLFCFQLQSQDLLTKNDDQVLKVEIVKIDEETISYYEYQDTNRILFTTSKTDFKKIEFVDFVPKGNAIPPAKGISKQKSKRGKFIVDGKEGYSFKELGPFLLSNDLASSYFKDYEKRKRIAHVFGTTTLVIGSVGTSFIILGTSTDNLLSPIPIIFGGFIVLVGVPITGTVALIGYFSSKSSKNKSIKAYGITSLYEEQFKTKEHPTIKMGMVSSGVGVQINF